MLDALTSRVESPPDRQWSQTARRVIGPALCARLLLVSVFLCALTAAFPLNAQEPEPPKDASEQFWANFILARPVSPRLYLEYDIEHAREVSGEDPFRYIYGTGMVEYYPKAWLDLTGELVTGLNRLTSGENSTEVSVRLGARFHLGNNVFWAWLPEKREAKATPD